MTVLDDAAAHVSRSPRPVRDDCTARGLGLSGRPHANHRTRERHRQPGFDRRVDACRERGATRTVIRPLGG